MTTHPPGTLSPSKTLLAMGFESLTPIQERAIALLAEGRSLFALAPTGSGKTLAFLVPLMGKIDTERAETQLVILVPTRELGTQIAQVAEKVAKAVATPENRGLTVRTAFGGQKIETQRAEMEKRPHVVIATPGRALDLLKREALVFSHLAALVLDEADHMLGMGFHDQIKDVCSFLPKTVQTALFSATEPELDSSLLDRLSRAAVEIDVRSEANKQNAAPNTEGDTIDRHEYLVAQNHSEKNALLIAFLKHHDSEIARGVLFCQTREGASHLGEKLRAEGFSAEELSGSLGQVERSTIMRRFKASGVKYLVATNIAARGIDVSELSLVINYDLPSTPTEYLHRSGRTGRAGLSGWTVSLCLKNVEEFFLDIASKNGHRPVKLGPIAGENSTNAALKASRESRAFERIHLNRGKSSKVRPGDIVGTLIQKLGLTREEVGNIFIFDHFSHIEVPATKTAEVIAKLNETKIKNLSVRASRAQELSQARVR